MISTRLVKIFVAALFLVSISACSTLFGEQGVFRGKSKDYLRSDTLETVRIPDGLESRPLTSLYSIPEIDPRDEFGDPMVLAADFEVPRPEPIAIEKGSVGVKLQKLGDQKWIFLNAPTTQVWPRTQNFLTGYGITVASSDPAAGVIKTADVVFNDSPEKKSRFRIAIEKGVHPETTEVHVVHVEFDAAETVPSDFRWPETSPYHEREYVMLEELATELARNIGNSAASLLGQNVGGDLKVDFLKVDDEPAMRLRLFEKRAKASISHALSEKEFYLWDQSDNGDLYYVGYKPRNKKDKNLLTRWFSEEIPEEKPYSLEKLLQHLAPTPEVEEAFESFDSVAFGEPLDEITGILVRVLPAQTAGVIVTVRSSRGERLPNEYAKKLLRTIRKNLI